MLSSSDQDEINLATKNLRLSVFLSLIGLFILVMGRFDLIVSSIGHS